MRIPDLIAALRRARSTSGKGVLRQIAEMLSLRYGRGLLGTSEYFEYQLFDDRRFTPAQKREFVGWRTKERLYYKLDLRAWSAFTVDKTTYQIFARGADLPVPALLGVYSARARHVPHAPWVQSPEELATFLRTALPYPAFAKPAISKWGEGAHLLRAFDGATDTLSIDDGRSSSVADFVDAVAAKSGGYLFQEVLRPDPAIAEVTGGRLCGLRIVVLNGGAGGPRMHRAILKVTAKGNVRDNFHHGATGNLLAKIDPATGRIEHLIKGGWPWPAVEERHPDTGLTMKGFELPRWREAVSLTLKAAAAFPGARLQGWDVALTDRGPVLLEINTPMDADLVQLASGTGLWDAEFDAFYREITGHKGPWFESI